MAVHLEIVYMPAMKTTAKSSTAVALRDDSAVYMTPDGELRLDVRVDKENDTVWLTQDQMAKLFGSSQRMMSYHTNSVFSDGELDRESNIQKMYIDRSKKPVTLHNLDVIISVGYRVRLFRDDATSRFDDNALVALALLVAESDPKQKVLVNRLILAMLSQ